MYCNVHSNRGLRSENGITMGPFLSQGQEKDCSSFWKDGNEGPRDVEIESLRLYLW